MAQDHDDGDEQSPGFVDQTRTTLLLEAILRRQELTFTPHHVDRLANDARIAFLMRPGALEKAMVGVLKAN